MQFCADQLDEFRTGRFIQKSAGKSRSSGNGILFLHPAHLHAKMLRFDDHSDAERVHCILDTIADLIRKPFLYLQAARKSIHYARDLAQANDASVWDIRNMRLSEKRKHVMFAERIHFDIFYQNHLAVFFLEHRRFQDRCRIEIVTVREELHGFRDTFRRFHQALAFRFFTDLFENDLVFIRQAVDSRLVVLVYFVVSEFFFFHKVRVVRYAVRAGCANAPRSQLPKILHIIIFCFHQFDAMQFHAEIFYFGFDLFPDGHCNIFGRGHDIFQEIDINVQVAVIELRRDLCADQLAQVFQVHDITKFRIDIAFYRDKKIVVMAMPVRIGASAKHLVIFFFGPFRAKKTVCCIKPFAAGNINHGAKVVMSFEFGRIGPKLIHQNSVLLPTMKILLVSATYMEISPLVANLRFVAETSPRIKTYTLGENEIDVLTTGVGMLATAFWCSQLMTKKKYDLALNFGVCGSFDPALTAGKVVHVVADRIAELGAEDGEKFLDVHELSLLGENDFPFKWGQLVNLSPLSNPVLNTLPAVHAISVNTVHGNEKSIAFAAERFKPHVESMEGAAFMYACLMNELVFAQVRSVSNRVERRNREAWKMAEAIRALGETGLEILKGL